MMLMLVALVQIADVTRLIAVVLVLVALVGVVDVPSGFRFAHADYLPTQFPGTNPEFHCASGPGRIQWAARRQQETRVKAAQTKVLEIAGRTAQVASQFSAGSPRTQKLPRRRMRFGVPVSTASAPVVL